MAAPLRLLRLLVSTAMLAGLLVVAGPVLESSPPAQAAPVEIFLRSPGPLGPISVLGDSVLLGSGITSPTLAARLAEQGWGPVRFRAGEGYRTGRPAPRSDLDVSRWISGWRAEGWNPRNVVVNLGANDSGICGTNLSCARTAILHVVDHLGPAHRIWWPMITQFPYNQGLQDTWNLALTQIAAERPNVFTWDWPAVMAAEGFVSADRIHLSADGYRRRSQLMAQAITTDLATASRSGNDAPVPAAIGGPTEYVALAPTRVADTRSSAPGRLAGGSTLTLDLRNQVPEGTTAVAVNLGAVAPGGNGFITAHPCDRPRREVSSLNYRAGATRAAMAVIPLSANGRLCVYTRQPSDLIVDLQGAFVPTTAAPATSARFTPLDTPRRLVDTRRTGRTTTLRLPTPSGAVAVAVNITTTGAPANGFITAYPCDRPRPTVSNVNLRAGETIAGSAFVPTGDGAICVFSSTSTDVIVDLTGTFRSASSTGSGGLRFVPAEPSRMLDTRSGIGGWSPVHGRRQILDVRVAPQAALAVTGTLTHLGVGEPGFLTAYGCGNIPPTSSVNGLPGQASANSVTTAVLASRLCVIASATSQTLFDTTGWWVP